VGLLGWLSRRVLAFLIFAPLLGFWYGLFAYVIRLPPGWMGLGARPEQEIVVAAVVAALISDFLIVRAVKRVMKAREAPAKRA
jgi:hypothetical protein